MIHKPSPTRDFRRIIASVVFIALLSAAIVPALGVSAAAPKLATVPPLGNAASFSVLAALSMSAAGAGTTISGDLGLSPGLASSKTGLWNVGGSEYFGTGGLSQNAQDDALIAFNNLAGQSSDGAWGTDPWSPVPGVYNVASDTTFNGTITLSGDADDVWVFQVGGDMTFSGSVVLAGETTSCNVFWQIGRDATIASGSAFVGTLIASRDISLVSGATVDGRIISLNSSLTTDGNTITTPICAEAVTDTPTPTATSTSTATPTRTPRPPRPPQDTPVPPATATLIPDLTATANAIATSVATTQPVVGLPDTGGTPPSSDSFMWTTVLAALVVGALGVGLGVRERRRVRQTRR